MYELLPVYRIRLVASDVMDVSGFFADGGSAAQGEFLKAASAYRESYRFAHTNVEDLLSKHGVSGEYVAFLFHFRFTHPEDLQLFICTSQGDYSVPAT